MLKLQRLSYISLFVSCLLLCGTLIRTNLRTAHEAVPPSSSPLVGTRLSLQDISWEGSDKTIVLALSSHCHFCLDSIPFYKRLTEASSHSKAKVRVIAVMPEALPVARTFLSEHSLNIDNLISGPLDALHVAGTPTVLIVDKKGKVTQAWVGELSSSREADVTSAIN